MGKKNLITLREFVRQSGSQEAAARIIGYSLLSVNRWLLGKFRPNVHARKRLNELGIGEIG